VAVSVYFPAPRPWMSQFPVPTALDPSWTRVSWQPAEPSETLTVPGGHPVPLAGVTDTCTLSVVWW
jgi:hypothetical protein